MIERDALLAELVPSLWMERSGKLPDKPLRIPVEPKKRVRAETSSQRTSERHYG